MTASRWGRPMPDKNDQPPGGYEPSDPWAPPQHRTSLDKPEQAPQPPPGSVHDQPTMIGMPPSAVPPPPAAPGGADRPPPPPSPYGYPGAPSAPVPPQPAAPYYGDTTGGTGAGYGYPAGPGAVPGYPAPGQTPGYPGYPGYAQTGWQQPPANGMGVAALVLGIISVVGFCLYGLSILLGVLALIFGIIGRRRVRRGEANNAGMALAGIILGSIGAVISAVFLALVIWAVVNGDSLDDTEDNPFGTSLVIGTARPAAAH